MKPASSKVKRASIRSKAKRHQEQREQKMTTLKRTRACTTIGEEYHSHDLIDPEKVEDYKQDLAEWFKKADWFVEPEITTNGECHSRAYLRNEAWGIGI